jgi:Flp pilus assembly protein TadD
VRALPRKASHVNRSDGGRSPPRAGFFSTRVAVRAVLLLAAFAGTVGVVLYLLPSFPGRVLPYGEGLRQPASVGPSGPLKPARPVFEIPDEPSETQRRVAELRDKSFEVAERLVDAFPDCPEAHHVLGTVHQRHRNEAGAVQLWEKCLQLNPRFADAHYSLGRLAFTKGDYATAETHLRRAMELDPRSAVIPLQLGETLMPRGQFAEAVEVLETFVSYHPDSAEGWVRLGQAYQQAGDAQNAKRCHRKAIDLDPGQLDAYYGAGLALQKLGETDQAAKYLEQFRKFKSQQSHVATELSPERGDQLRMEITLTNTYMLAGEVHARKNDAAGTERNWRAAAAFDPEHRESRFRLVELYHHVGRYGEAWRFCQEYCRLEPDDPVAWLTLGVLGVRSRRLDEAETALRRAIELGPDQAKPHAVLAQIRMLPDRDPRRLWRWPKPPCSWNRVPSTITSWPPRGGMLATSTKLVKTWRGPSSWILATASIAKPISICVKSRDDEQRVPRSDNDLSGSDGAWSRGATSRRRRFPARWRYPWTIQRQPRWSATRSLRRRKMCRQPISI